MLKTKTFKLEIDATLGIYDHETRYIICAPDGTMLDDAQGYGYKTAQTAHKAAWYRFNGGKKKVDNERVKALAFWKKYKSFSKTLKDVLETEFKAPPTDDELNSFAIENGVSGFDINFVKYL